MSKYAVKRPCLTCGIPTSETYCAAHKRTPRRAGQQSRVKRTRAERERRRQAVEAHVALNGWLCPGYGREPHPSYDLTADHLVPQAHGGVGGPLAVLCRSCNGRKGAKRVS